MVRTLRPEKNRKRRRIALILATALLLVLLAFFAYRMFVASRPTTQTSSPSTTTETFPETAPPIASIAAEGEIVPLRSAELSFTVSGLIANLLVSEGDSVEAGQPLVQLAAEDLGSSLTQAEAGVTQAQAGLQAAESQLTIAQTHTAVTAAQIKSAQAGVAVAEAQRSSAEANVSAVATEAQVVILQAEATLAEAQARVLQAQANLEQAQAADAEAKATISQAEAAMEEARASVAQAEAAYQAAKATLDKTLLHAPFAGKVASLDAEVGEAISPGVPVVKLTNAETWLVKTTDLTELDVVNLDVGQNVTITVDALPSQTFEGTITHIAEVSELKRGDVTYEVTVTLKNSEALPLRWGMTSFVDFGTP